MVTGRIVGPAPANWCLNVKQPNSSTINVNSNSAIDVVADYVNAKGILQSSTANIIVRHLGGRAGSLAWAHGSRSFRRLLWLDWMRCF